MIDQHNLQRVTGVRICKASGDTAKVSPEALQCRTKELAATIPVRMTIEPDEHIDYALAHLHKQTIVGYASYQT